jgi:cobyrinic acid a,c-diamide synthase
MRKQQIPRVLLSAVSSGSGKTTMMLALLAALKKRGLRVQTMKTGPDYIDPMYHEKVTGRPGLHADPFFSDTVQLKQLLNIAATDADLVVIEGAMGFYDGIGTTSDASTYTVSQALCTPTLLVLSPKGMGCSLAAMCKGFLSFRRPNHIAGILLSGVSKTQYSYYREIIESELHLPVYGYLPKLPLVELKSRHLGLELAGEVESLSEKLEILGNTALETLDLDGILALSDRAALLEIEPQPEFKKSTGTFRLGVSSDAAFCFVYPENLRLLEAFGAELVPISPLRDQELPQDLDGLYLCGGYPELHLKALSGNQQFLASLRAAAEKGMPIFAECGGFLYLQEAFCDADGTRYPMAGLLPGVSHLTEHLCRFGYVTLIFQEDSILGKTGTTIRGHEFHYADSSENGSAFLAMRPNGKHWTAYQSVGKIVAGFPHLYFPSNPAVPEAFAATCREYQQSRTKENLSL